MARRQWRRSSQLTRMILADLDFIRINQRPWDVTGANTRRLRHWLQPAGWLYQIIHCKILNYCWYSNYFRALNGHSLIGLDDDSMILLGGYIDGSGYQTGIWRIKENVWSRIGELTQVENFIIFWWICNFRVPLLDQRSTLRDQSSFSLGTARLIQITGLIWWRMKRSKKSSELGIMQEPTTTQFSSRQKITAAYENIF